MMPHVLTRSLDRSATVFLIVVAAFGVLIPLSNLLLPAGSMFQVPTYLVALFGKYVCYAILALSIDLIWGYCGILSLGHGAFFALGGYAMGMYLMRQIGSRGVYGNPILPDFMVFLNYPKLPWYWHGFDMFWFAALMVVLVPGLLAFCFGWLAFRSRVTGVYLSIITQAMPNPAPDFSATASNPTSCSCSRCRRAWPASQAPSMYRRSASSIPASSRRQIPSRR
jgi:urea transport system permease protein